MRATAEAEEVKRILRKGGGEGSRGEDFLSFFVYILHF
jgi:hypothetical protein